ncbi:MAG: trehalose-6-phosphate synthase [Pseudomonadota bacterium]
MSRLIVLSNRIPTEAEPAGGLVVALHDCLMREGGIWIGSSAEPQETAHEALTEIGSGPYRRLAFDLSHDEHENFYLGYANSVLWPLFHRRSDLIGFDAAFAEAYAAVNARVARLLASVIAPGDLVWVHDYHFLPVARELRALGVANRIGFFLHTPFPLAADIPALPERDEFPEWLAAFDLVGLQTERDVSALQEHFRADPAAIFDLEGGVHTAHGSFLAAAFPIGIDVDSFLSQAEASDGAERLALAPDQKLLIGVDRLDYSKGIVNRFEAFGAYLADRPDDAPRASLIQIAPPSRAELEAYRDIRTELETTSGALNGAYAELDWTPIRYIRRNVKRERLAGLYRRADAALVTPLADGMNLVAKEFVAAQDPDDPGVLILSHFAGAAEQMGGALLVNPYDTGEMARAIASALEMPLADRQARHAGMMEELRARDISWWTESFLSTLAAQTHRAAAE